MTAIITENLRTFNSTQFLSAFNQLSYDKWLTGTNYTIGDIVFANFYKYIAISTGTSGGTIPSHISGTSSDGGVSWLFVENYINSSFYTNNIYIAIGHKEAWTPDDAIPADPIDTFNIQQDNLKNIVSAKKLTMQNVKLGIIRNNWTSGTIYNKFDPEIEAFDYSGVNSGTPFYVYQNDNGNLNIYKCIDNNGNTASTSAPTGQSVNNTITADGYVWKFMANVEAANSIAFLTSNYIPVDLKLSDTDTSAQKLVQDNAKAESLSRINISNAGVGYTVAPTITFSNENAETVAVGIANISGGIITNIQLTNIGVGYDNTPTITITPDVGDTITTIATAEAIMSPKEGHGHNILEELNARYVIISSRFEDTEGGYFPIDDDFREVFVIVDPKDSTGNIATELRYIGENHADYITNPNSLNKIDNLSGSILYAESITPVVRQVGQIEDLKIVLKM